MPRALALALLTALSPAALAAQNATERQVYICDLNGMPGQLTVDVEVVGNSGIAWGAGPNPLPTPVPTGDVTIYTAGELRSGAAYYTFRGENAYADWVDHMTNQRFRVEWQPQPDGSLILVINPFGPGPSRHYCQRAG